MGHETPPQWDRSMRDRLRRGEAAALSELYDRFASLAYTIAQRVLDDEEVTSQVTAEVFARIWERPEDFDPEEGPMRSWFAAEAHRRAVDRLREQFAADHAGLPPAGLIALTEPTSDAGPAPAPRTEPIAGTPTDSPAAALADPADPTGPADPAERLRAASTAARADYIVTAMPAPLRAALELTRFEHQDYRRMARELGISEAEACRRLRLGLQLLSTAAEYPVGTTASDTANTREEQP